MGWPIAIQARKDDEIAFSSILERSTQAIPDTRLHGPRST
jgi:hypothetical protein